MRNFNDMWFCPKDKSKLHEKTLRNQGGKFRINIDSPETGINNALAVRKISEGQKTQASALINALSEALPEKMVFTLVSVECPICNFQNIAPDLKTVGALVTDKSVRKGQMKTIRSITKEAETTAKKSSPTQGRRPSFFLIIILAGLVVSLLGAIIVSILEFLK